MDIKKLIGPFRQILTLDKIPIKGPVSDNGLEILYDSGVVVMDGYIYTVGSWLHLLTEAEKMNWEVELLDDDYVLLPGMVDCHTHICWAGNRSRDFSHRINGKSYMEIAQSGGGIWSTVLQTREIEQKDLLQVTAKRAMRLLKNGVTTAEVKSGYCLDVDGELKMLRIINQLNKDLAIDLIPTNLAAHIPNKDSEKDPLAYLEFLVHELWPKIIDEKLSKRVDIFIEESAYSPEEGNYYMAMAHKYGFSVTAHVDQFTAGGSLIAVQNNAISVDHLEASTEKEIKAISKSGSVAVVLPGASIGLGGPFAPARKLLDLGCCVAIASDWNPGSAPQGDLLAQASILATYEKLSSAEIFSGFAFRAANALDLPDRGKIVSGFLADFIAFPVYDYQDILYNQGNLKPKKIWKKGVLYE